MRAMINMPIVLAAIIIISSISAAAETEITMSLDMGVTSTFDGILTFSAQNTSESMIVKASNGDVLSKQINLNVTPPFNWQVSLTINGTKALDLEGEANLNSGRYTKTYYNGKYLRIIEDTPVTTITAKAIEARLTPVLTLKEYSGTYTIEGFLDSNGDIIFQDYERASITLKPQGNTLETELPPFASAMQVAKFAVNVSDETGQITKFSGNYDFSKNVAVTSGETYIDSKKVTQASLGVEYRVGDIVIRLPNDAFVKTKGNITSVSGNYLEISLKSNKSIISNATGQFSLIVISNETKIPIEGAFVTVNNGGKLINSTNTDKDGMVVLNLMPERYEVMVQKFEYYPKSDNYTVGLKPVKVVVELERKPTIFNKISSMASTALSNPLLSGIALVVAVVAILVARRRRR